MYVTPQTNLKVYRNIPWNDDYKHTRWFLTVAQQTQYFASKIAYSFQNFTYVRQSGVIRVSMIADNLYNCNYISFQNESYGNKVFYAFITKVEYINNETSNIYFSIDEVQSWMFQYQLEQCFVEREHVSDDTVGKHTVDEKLEIGEYQIENETKLLSEVNAVLLSLASSQVHQDNIIGNIPSFVESYGETSPYGFINVLVQQIMQSPEKVAMFRMIVSDMVDDSSDFHVNNLKTFQENFAFSREQNIVFHNSCENTTYTPKNNKLKCFPYCCFTVDNFNGDVTQYKWEEFESPYSANFIERGTPLPVPTMECYPVDYKKNYSNPTASPTKQFRTIFDNFPEIPMSSDTFKLWQTSQFKKDVASQGASVTLGVLSSIGMVVAGGLTENPVLMGTGFATGLATAVKGAKQNYDISVDYKYHKLHDSTLTGSFGNAGLCWNDNEVGFRFTEYRIKAEYAQIIDNFFTRFGYRVDTIKTPEITSRRFFNYVKTIDASIKGDVPNEAQKTICAIFNAGVTLWHTDDVGNYNVNNVIVG